MQIQLLFLGHLELHMGDADVVCCCLHSLVLYFLRRSISGDGGVRVTEQMRRQI